MSHSRVAIPLERDRSMLQRLRDAPADQRAAFMRGLPPDLLHSDASTLRLWRFTRRPSQIPPQGDWRWWLFMAGRGAGKSRSGAEEMRSAVDAGTTKLPLCVGSTAADVRDVMVEGPSGLLVALDDLKPRYLKSDLQIVIPDGPTIRLRSADAPNRLRGLNSDFVWCDEIAAWRYPDAFDQIEFGLRIERPNGGGSPRGIATTTPRPLPLIKELIAREDVTVTVTSTYANAAHLDPGALARLTARYEGTPLGRQELHAELIDEIEGALWTRHIIDAHRAEFVAEYRGTHHSGRYRDEYETEQGGRAFLPFRASLARRVWRDQSGSAVRRGPLPPKLVRVVVGVDPSVGKAASETSANSECGIVAAGLGDDGEYYLLDDWSLSASPDRWALRVSNVALMWDADCVVAEGNQGGDLVRHVLHTVNPDLPVRTVHAQVSKQARAEPVAALAEQGRLHHVGMMPLLEDQFCQWAPMSGMPSPDRLDAAVWAVRELMRAREGADEIELTVSKRHARRV